MGVRAAIGPAAAAEKRRLQQLFRARAQLIVVALDGGFAWVILVSSFIANMVMDGIVYSFGMLLEVFADAFDTPITTASIAGALLAGIYLSEGPILTPLIQRFGYRPVAISGCLIAGTGFFISSIANSIGLFIFSYGVLGGVAIGLVYLPSMLIVCQYFDKYRALATGISAAGSGLGMLVFAPLTKALNEYYGWRGAMMIFSALSFQTLPFCLLFLELRFFYYDKLRKLKAEIYRGQLPVDNNVIQEQKSELGESQAIKLHVLLSGLQTDQSGVDAPLLEEEELETTDDLWLPKDDHNATKPNQRRYRAASRASDDREHRKSVSHCAPSLDSSDAAPCVTVGIEAGTTSRRRTKSASIDVTVDNHTDAVGRPFDRLDAVYQGSIKRLDMYKNALAKSREALAAEAQSQSQLQMSARVTKEDQMMREEKLAVEIYTKQVSLAPTQVTDEEDVIVLPNERRSFRLKLCGLFNNIFAFRLLKVPNFTIYLIGNFFGFVGIMVIMMYVPNHAKHIGANEQQQALLIVIVGALNTIGRVFFNYLAQRLPGWRRLLLHNIVTILAGAITLFMPFFTQYWCLCLYCAVVGLAMAPINSMTQTLLIDFCGLEGLTSTFGLMCMIRGTAWFLGPPLGGAIRDATNSYDATFVSGGCVFLCAGLIFCVALIPCLQRRQSTDEAEAAEKR